MLLCSTLLCTFTHPIVVLCMIIGDSNGLQISDITPYYKKIIAIISLFEDAIPLVNFALITINGGAPTVTSCCLTSSKLCRAFLVLY